MGIRTNTEDRFEASIRSLLTGIILLVLGTLFAAIGGAALGEGEGQGAIFLAIGLGMAGLGTWLLWGGTRITLDRTTNTATIRLSGLFGSSESAFPLNEVARARVLKQRRSGKRLYKLVLVVGNGDTAEAHSLTGGYSSGGWPKGRMCRAINAWLGVDEED